jgi:fatty acid desaturase
VAPKEQPQPETIAEKVSEPVKKEENPKLDLYMRADHVYQEMLRIENQEKIRLQLAIRYTLLMFAIFLVFAWIVSNRVIMFGFSEFVWLARIRDALFAVMAGLFSLTIWFGSVSWMRQIFIIALLRTIALVFFVAVIVALYIPLW